MMTYDETSPDYFTQATLENSKLIMLYDNTTGGPDYVHMLKIMCVDAVFVNNSKSTDLHLAPLTFLLKGLNRHDRLQMDFITDLPPVNGFDSILVVVDQGLTKGVILTPCKKTITAEETGRLLLENLYKRFRLPDKIISD